MRRQSLAAAQRCETATGKKCKCRCGGKLHGVKRGETERFFKMLPREDPHHALPKGEREPKLLPLFEGI